ncbi:MULTISPECIES: HAD family hydrolase [Methylomonas]|nr:MULTISPECIES: HAD family phosphatase [Methylomonas]TCV83589.1 HAD superfamily hydrolase (TIGR01509 family) [Methylomonas methanica]
MKERCWRAVIFDMDGLVLDSEPTYVRAWQAAIDELGFTMPAQFWTSLSGCSGKTVTQRLQEQCGVDFDLERFQQLSSVYWLAHVQQHGIAVKPGFFVLLDVLAQYGLPFCLATNSPLAAARQCLAWAGLTDIFPRIVAGDTVRAAKPAPDIFLRASAELAQPVQDCLVLEDSPIGIRAALAAGASCVFVPSLQPADAWAAEHADYLLDDLQQVADFISARQHHPL